MNLDDLRKIAENATPGPWERGDRWHVQGADMCMCRERYGPLVAEVARDINGQLMLAHVHLGEEPWHEIGIVSSELYEGKYVQQVIVEADEYGAMSDEDALFVTTFNPHAVLALLDRVETAERERDAYRDGTTITKLAVAEQALQRVRELHRNSGASQGYTDEGYGNIEDCCGVCGTFGEYGEPWPCPTIMAVEGDA